MAKSEDLDHRMMELTNFGQMMFLIEKIRQEW